MEEEEYKVEYKVINSKYNDVEFIGTHSECMQYKSIQEFPHKLYIESLTEEEQFNRQNIY